MPQVAFVIAGAQKGGTTALHAFLGQHPDLFMPALKELHYFDKREKLPDRLGIYWRYHRHFRAAPKGAIRGEATPIYMFWPGVAARMARYNPAMKLIILLREPGARAHSQWHMETERGRETRSFADAIRSAEPAPPDRVQSYLGRGFYSAQLAELYRHFPKEQVFVRLTEDLRDAPAVLMAELEQHLGLAPHAYSGLDRVIRPREQATAQPMAAEDRAFLDRHFAAEIAALSEMLSRDLSHWTGKM